MEQEEKLKTAATAMASNFKAQTFGGAEKTTDTVVGTDIVERIISDWNAAPKKVANLTINQYGPPNSDVKPADLVWKWTMETDNCLSR